VGIKFCNARLATASSSKQTGESSIQKKFAFKAQLPSIAKPLLKMQGNPNQIAWKLEITMVEIAWGLEITMPEIAWGLKITMLEIALKLEITRLEIALRLEVIMLVSS
jgi:hypothetical protein